MLQNSIQFAIFQNIYEISILQSVVQEKEDNSNK